MIIRRYTSTKTLSYSSGSIVSELIDRNGYITEIGLKLATTYNTASSVSAAEDGLANLISSLRIATAGRDFFNVNNGKQLLFLSRCMFQDQIRNDALSTTGSQTGVVDYYFPIIHLGMKFYDPADKSVVIPASELTSLNIEVGWGTNSSLGTGYTITAGTLYWTITEILLQVGENPMTLIYKGGKTIPRMSPITKSVSSAYTNLSLEEDTPVGDLLSWVLVIAYGSTTSARCNNLITELGIKFPKEASTPFRSNFQQLVAETRRMFALSSDYKGVVFLPLSLISGDDLGFDLSSYQVGDCKIAYTTSLSDTTEDSAQSSGGTIYQLFYNIGS